MGFRRRSFRRILGRLPVAEKNYVLNQATGVAGGTVSTLVVASADDLGNDNSVSFPCKIKMVYVVGALLQKVQTAGGTLACAMYKDTGGAGVIINPNAIIPNRDQIQMFWWQRMLEETLSLNAFKFAGWIRIPKRFQIFNEGDQLRFTLNATDNYDHCVNFVYKWSH